MEIQGAGCLTRSRTVLSKLDLFEGTEPAVLDRLAMLAHPFEIDAGEQLFFDEGDPGDRIFLLSSWAPARVRCVCPAAGTWRSCP